ncbi:MAG: symmetrical bis(5'-nucleosyl)-tetraphosphatase [Gammaproteobacteria bacterium]|nr:symmetrical bis(5'-nucleosyl)-tetraphosphatase [Gammaproteobacteria bacterium]
MALYAIGDVQGCYDPLQRLLEKISFDPQRDQVWFTGDLVNRGPQSADVLRFVAGLGDSAITVLGNHDLHLLAVAAGVESHRKRDTLDGVLSAPDRTELLSWLKTRPLLHHDPKIGVTLVHAGLLPDWDLALAQECAQEAETVIGGAKATDFFRIMYGNLPDRWSPELSGWERLRLIVNAFTRLRFCTADGRMDYAHKGAIGSQPAELMPWFQVPGRRSCDQRIVFGHWSTLGQWSNDGVMGIDTGCLWGGALTAVHLTKNPLEFTRVDCCRQATH